MKKRYLERVLAHYHMSFTGAKIDILLKLKNLYRQKEYFYRQKHINPCEI